MGSEPQNSNLRMVTTTIRLINGCASIHGSEEFAGVAVAAALASSPSLQREEENLPGRTERSISGCGVSSGFLCWLSPLHSKRATIYDAGEF
ncbi:hypothetical protein R1flu_003853 [Riccia fluitans]|uniref:Uncharacterized protein n=1 Tax=Riccia fluitans TaxID=41844 RepID=A0ABD1YA71_9MARC